MNIISRSIVILVALTTIVLSKELITPIPNNAIYDKQKAILGKKLFFDIRLSANDTISCANCHFLNDGGDDNIALSFGIDGKVGSIHSPTVYNSRYNIAQFWDGRAKNLKEQVSGPIHNPVEMGTNFKDIIEKLKKDETLVKEFGKLYEYGITKDSIIDAIVEFENALVTPNAPFDKFLRGDFSALDDLEKEGFQLFKDYGCISCHNGVNIGGNLFQKVGIVKKFESELNNLGKFESTNNENDKNYFKVPTLRNIDKTAPYFHDGSVDSLKKAVLIMFEVQLGIEPQDDEVEKIVKFLQSLNGEIPSIIKQSDQ
ncbi:MAG: cytochrome-c peroxidase [Campylobacterota bacterium]|nr:cytochrome-c peroxidase [Campylobacterota bacterium]